MNTLIKNQKRRIEALRNFSTLSEKQRANLLKKLQSNNLLTPDFANTKTAKNMGFGYLSMILHLAPSNLSGYNTCPAASAGCKAACLNTAGRGRFESIQLARIQKTLYFVKAREIFMHQLFSELQALERRAAKAGLKAVVRLNGTSDLPWENLRLDGLNVFEKFPNIQFYDYTKVLKRIEYFAKNPIANYDLTFSAAEDNEANWRAALSLGFNVAMVFIAIPEQYFGIKTINGDAHDLRFTDLKGGYIVALKAKGQAKKDVSGFVKHIYAIKAA
jgi:hypothetical protein